VIVVDASMALAWHFPGEATDETEAVLDRVIDDGMTVPVHWRAEIANGFALAVRRKSMTPQYRGQALEKLTSLDITIDAESGVQLWETTQHLCDRYRLTAYDAAYLELAQRLRLPLATLDRELLESARQAGVAIWSGSRP
jgi:predicted nucleic acid-binding protein